MNNVNYAQDFSVSDRSNDEIVAIIVIRVKRDGTFAVSKPCSKCTNMLYNFGIKGVLYTDWVGEIVYESIESLICTATEFGAMRTRIEAAKNEKTELETL